MRLVAIIVSVWLAGIAAASAQSVTAIGPITPGDCTAFLSTTVVKNGGPCASANFANPTGAVGLSAVPGSTAMRSDAAPPLSASVQSALTGTNNLPAFGTGAFGYTSRALVGADLPIVPLSKGGLAGDQSAATANQIPVFPGGGGAAAPTSATSWFDAFCSSTVGNFWVRQTGGWGCTSLGYSNPVWWGADPTDAAESTSAFNSALTASNTVRFPPGKFKFNSAIAYNIPNTIASVTIAGAGQDVTILTWPNASGGISFNYQNAANSVHVRELSITTGTTNGGTGLTLNPHQ